MDDQQRQPREGDRSPVRHRIQQAVAQGRISPADGDIRLTNVSSAQSMAELGLIVRDLDQLDAVRPAAPLGTQATPVPLAGSRSRSALAIVIAVLAVLLVAGGAVALFAVGGTTGSSHSATGDDLPSALPLTAGTAETEPVAPSPSYRLSAEGIRDFLSTYRTEFSTSKVVELTLYDDYVIVQVPIAGRARHAGRLYRDGKFGDFGGVTANFPGAEVIDTAKLDIPALMRNIGKARRTLKVEDFNQTYVTLNYRPQFDEVPNVNIYVSNEFNESGYLATTLDGGVERSYPFGG